MRHVSALVIILGVAFGPVALFACKSPGECVPAAGEDVALFRAVCAALDEGHPARMTVLLGDASGRRLTYTRGGASPDEVLPTASAAKWLTSAVVLRLVEAGTLSLEDHPQDHLPWASDDEADPRSAMTLAQLLAFTAGFELGPVGNSCVRTRDTTVDACARELYEDHFTFEPGSTFYYGPAGMKIAAAMVESTTGGTFQAAFREHIADVVGMSDDARFGLPSESNPNPAGGAELRATDYEALLLALSRGEILSASLEDMHADHTPAGEVVLASSPADVTGYEWHYGLGNWLECYSERFDRSCEELRRVSSPGAFGMYPWLDLDDGRWGIVATDNRVLQASKHSVQMIHDAEGVLDAALSSSPER